MIDKFTVPDDFTIDWGSLSMLPIREQAVWLFLYAQKGKTITINAMQIMFLDAFTEESELEHTVLKIFAIKGGLQWTDF